MISGGIQPGSLVNARAIICGDPDPKMQSDCIDALDGVKTGDDKDKPVLQDVIYFCGHDPDTFQQMTNSEKTRATACNVDVFNQPTRYKQGDATPASVTVNGRPLNRFLSFENSKRANLPVEDGKTTADDLFKKVAGKPTAAEEAAKKAEETKKALFLQDDVLRKQRGVFWKNCQEFGKNRYTPFCSSLRAEMKKEICKASNLLKSWVELMGGRKIEEDKGPYYRDDYEDDCSRVILVASAGIFCLDGEVSEHDFSRLSSLGEELSALLTMLEFFGERRKCPKK